ncbi:MAG: hypothetical protein JO244_09225 [Solirubrobacterales bacterium]|nr:hypothetical protein [Solirubrobacterales bacterium]
MAELVSEADRAVGVVPAYETGPSPGNHRQTAARGLGGNARALQFCAFS